MNDKGRVCRLCGSPCWGTICRGCFCKDRGYDRVRYGKVKIEE